MAARKQSTDSSDVGPQIRRGLSAPLYVIVDVNSSCQLRCRYCTSMPFSEKDIPTERLLEVLTELRRLGCVQYSFSGGEPFLHPGFPKILAHCLELGIPPSVNTNGLFFANPESVKGYKAMLGRNAARVFLNVSLDSADVKDNDSARGLGSIVLSGIEAILSEGWPIMIRGVVHRGTLDSALGIVERYYPRITMFGFFRVLPTVQTAKSPKHTKLLLTDDEFRQFCARATRLKIDRPDLRLQLPDREITREQAGVCAAALPFCYCGYTKAYIDPELNVYPCTHSRVSAHCFGNLRGQSFAQVWKSERASEARKAGLEKPLCEMVPFENRMAIRYKSQLQVID